MAGLTAWQVVVQSWLIHPDWDAVAHRSYLQFDAAETFRHLPNVEVIEGWLEQLRMGNR